MTTHTKWKDTTWEEYWESLLIPKSVYLRKSGTDNEFMLKSICLVCGNKYWKCKEDTRCGTPQCVKRCKNMRMS